MASRRSSGRSRNVGWLDPFAPRPTPDDRFPRRPQVDVLTVRVDLKGSRPIVWRRLELRTDLIMADLHRVLQAAFGWYDSHLWLFRKGVGRPHDDLATKALCPYQVEEGDPGHDAEAVRLDEFVGAPGDALSYLYDFGDGWVHVLKVEKVRPAADDDPPARLVGGRRAGAPEDCGGVWGMAELVEAGELDPDDFDPALCAAGVAHALDDFDDLDLFGDE